MTRLRYQQIGQPHQALFQLQQMESRNCYPNISTFVSLFSCASDMGDLDVAVNLYDNFSSKFQVESGQTPVAAESAMLMFAKCGSTRHVESVSLHYFIGTNTLLLWHFQIFSKIPKKSSSMWNHMIQLYLWYIQALTNILTANTYFQSGQYAKGIKLIAQMQQEGKSPDVQTFTTLFSICGKLKDSKLTNQIYTYWSASGMTHTEFTASSSIAMLTKCGMIDQAVAVLIFDKLL